MSILDLQSMEPDLSMHPDGLSTLSVILCSAGSFFACA